MKHSKLERYRSTENQKRVRAEPRVIEKLQEWTRSFKILSEILTCDKIYVSLKLA